GRDRGGRRVLELRAAGLAASQSRNYRRSCSFCVPCLPGLCGRSPGRRLPQLPTLFGTVPALARRRLSRVHRRYVPAHEREEFDREMRAHPWKVPSAENELVNAGFLVAVRRWILPVSETQTQTWPKKAVKQREQGGGVETYKLLL